MAGDQLVVVPDGIPPPSVEGTEPTGESGRGAVNTLNIREGGGGVVLGATGRGVDLRLLFSRAAVEAGPLEDARNSEGTREVHSSNILNGGVELVDVAIGVDEGEAGRWLDGVSSSTRSSEVVRGGDLMAIIS